MQWITDWLTKEGPPSTSPLCDFNRLSYELRPGDVLLVEGRSRVSDVIKTITQSTWTHSALFIGRIYDIRDPQLQQRVRMAYQGDLGEQLMVEALLGEGTIIAPVSKYRKDHLRICRPTGLEPADAHKVVAHAIQHIGFDYDLRHLLDLARFFFPWTILPRRWRSSLFEHNAGSPTRAVCSSLLASAFNSVNFPILPFIDRDEDGSLRFFKRNPRLFTPKDFDYSPYFDIIKYPFLGLDDLGVYRRLPWCDETILYNDDERAFVAATKGDVIPCLDDRTLFGMKPKKEKVKQPDDQDEESQQPVPNTLREADQ
ncbi:MAG: YiiX/YebB-like N1pC/P60 family cysteine hydrolase [Candidatus Thiodiazotropha sp. (ex. Lucinoma kazani)]